MKPTVLTGSESCSFTAYAYDELDRLIEETVVMGSSTNRVSWVYDLAGNRTSMTTGTTTNTYTLGTGDRLAMWGVNGENGYAYDAAGCVTQRVASARTLAMEWDGQYRLSAVRENGVAIETHGYDAAGRRAWTASGGVTTHYAYDGGQIVADLDANGQVIRSYIHAPGIDRLLAIVVHGTVPTKYACLTDHLGTVHALADETGSIVESYEYDAWGNILAVRDGQGNSLAASALGNRFLFQGREYSWATGIYNFRARWYDPETGRWLSNDPIGISGGLNQYMFCADDPVNRIDPWGLVDLSDIDDVAIRNRYEGAQSTIADIDSHFPTGSDFTMDDFWKYFEPLGERGVFSGNITKGGSKLPKAEQEIIRRFERDKKFNRDCERKNPHPNPIHYHGMKSEYARDWVAAERARMQEYADALKAELDRRSRPASSR